MMKNPVIAPANPGMTPEQAKQIRFQMWKRPAKVEERKKLREERLAWAKEVYGIGDNI